MHRYYFFYFSENQIALTESRDFASIYIYQENIMKIFSLEFNDTITNSDITKAVNNVGKKYLKDIKTRHEIHTCNDRNLYEVKAEDVDKIWNELYPALEKYFDSYELLQQYTGQYLLKAMLIEFNNFLSHVVLAMNNVSKVKNIESALGHLHRATLDGYKDIIVEENKLNNLSGREKQRSLFDLRLKEIHKVGCSSLDRKTIIKKYKKFVKTYLRQSLVA